MSRDATKSMVSLLSSILCRPTKNLLTTHRSMTLMEAIRASIGDATILGIPTFALNEEEAGEMVETGLQLARALQMAHLLMFCVAEAIGCEAWWGCNLQIALENLSDELCRANGLDFDLIDESPSNGTVAENAAYRVDRINEFIEDLSVTG